MEKEINFLEVETLGWIRVGLTPEEVGSPSRHALLLINIIDFPGRAVIVRLALVVFTTQFTRSGIQKCKLKIVNHGEFSYCSWQQSY
jgi:hypothetical protein